MVFQAGPHGVPTVVRGVFQTQGLGRRDRLPRQFVPGHRERHARTVDGGPDPLGQHPSGATDRQGDVVVHPIHLDQPRSPAAMRGSKGVAPLAENQ